LWLINCDIYYWFRFLLLFHFLLSYTLNTYLLWRIAAHSEAMHLIKFYFDNYSCTTETCVVYLKEDELEDTKGVIRFRISKNRPHNGQKKKYKRTNSWSTTRKVFKFILLLPFSATFNCIMAVSYNSERNRWIPKNQQTWRTKLTNLLHSWEHHHVIECNLFFSLYCCHIAHFGVKQQPVNRSPAHILFVISFFCVSLRLLLFDFS
jgi:hypothetical protein